MAATDSDTQPSGSTPGGADDARSKVWHVLDSYGVEEENIPGAETNLVDDILAVAGRAETTTEVRAATLREVSDDLRRLSRGQVIRDGNSWIKLGDLIDRLNEYERRADRAAWTDAD